MEISRIWHKALIQLEKVNYRYPQLTETDFFMLKNAMALNNQLSYLYMTYLYR